MQRLINDGILVFKFKERLKNEIYQFCNEFFEKIENKLLVIFVFCQVRRMKYQFLVLWMENYLYLLCLRRYKLCVLDSIKFRYNIGF